MDNFRTLISVQQLADNIDSPELRIFDCRFDLFDTEKGQNAWRKNHIPGAVYAHMDRHLSSPVSEETGRHPLPDPDLLRIWLSSSGVDDDTQVVVYDDTGGNMAVRLWWLLRWLGHERVAVLDGQWQAWEAAGKPLSDTATPPQAKVFEGEAQDDMWLSTQAVQANLDSKNHLVIDVRVHARFNGEMEPIDPIAGHIPGAVCLPVTGHLDENGFFKPAEELKKIYLDLLGTYDADQAVLMCGSGVAACQGLLAMEIAGLKNGKLFAGSWSEWIRNKSNPIATNS